MTTSGGSATGCWTTAWRCTGLADATRVGAGLPAKPTPWWMARASPVFAGKPAPTGIAPAFGN
ncbi:hypothetical protein C4Q27_06090 [Pseudomonas sp. SWI36]|nr:hypothetical protein C4Q27_06090 [Pseudomonas sp. SWI36]QNV69084.1 hypothetical protein F7661_27355 [Pseudomonas sp. CFA]